MSSSELSKAKQRANVKTILLIFFILATFPVTETMFGRLLPKSMQKRHTARLVRVLQEWSVLKSPLIIRDNRVLFVQPDWTVTILDCDSGEVLTHNVASRENREFIINTEDCFGLRQWETIGDIAYTSAGFPGFLIINLKNGEINTNYLGNLDPLLSGATLFVSSWKTGKILAIDTETVQAREFGQSKLRSYAAMRKQINVFAGTEGGIHNKVECYRVDTGELLWTRTSPADSIWLGMACDDSFVHVFVVGRDRYELLVKSRRQSSQTNDGIEIERVLIFNRDGKQVADRKATISDFGGQWPKDWSQWSAPFAFKGATYRNGRLYSKNDWLTNMRARAEKAEAIIRKKVAGQAMLTDRKGVVGFEYVSPPGAPKELYIFCIEKGWSWRGKIARLDNLLSNEEDSVACNPNLFRLAADDKHIYVGTADGRVECLDRNTGRSRWIYGFPVAPRWDLEMERAIGAKRLSKWYKASLSSDYYSPTSIDAGSMSPPSRIILDPNPYPRVYPNADTTNQMVWGVPLISICLLLLSRWLRQPDKLRKYAFRCRVLFWISLAAYTLFKRYSEPTLYLLLTAVVLAFILGEQARWQMSKASEDGKVPVGGLPASE